MTSNNELVKLELTFWVGRWMIYNTPDIDEQKILKKKIKELLKNL
jgi:hypothetical protein